MLSQGLEELLVWLKDTQYAKTVREIIDILNDENQREKKKDWLRQMLSIECGIFHIKWLGDCYVADFPSDGSSYPWLNYLARLTKLSQKVLK